MEERPGHGGGRLLHHRCRNSGWRCRNDDRCRWSEDMFLTGKFSCRRVDIPDRLSVQSLHGPPEGGAGEKCVAVGRKNCLNATFSIFCIWMGRVDIHNQRSVAR